MTVKKRLKNGNYARRVYHREPLDLPDNLLTQQQFKDECDVNRIVANAERGVPPRFQNRGAPQYGDFSDVPDLTQAHNIIREAREAFLNLPSQLRLELENNPANINRLTKDQIERYGLARGNPPSQQLPDTAGQAEPDPAPSKGGAKKASNDAQ